MNKKHQHVVPIGNKWGIKGEGNCRYTKIANTQREVAETARRIARNQQSELLIHGKDGRIRQKNSYGNDPFPPKG